MLRWVFEAQLDLILGVRFVIRRFVRSAQRDIRVAAKTFSEMGWR